MTPDIVCLLCNHSPALTDESDVCDCGGRYVSSSVKALRERESWYAIESAWEEFHAEHARIELPAATPNYLRIKQAG